MKVVVLIGFGLAGLLFAGPNPQIQAYMDGLAQKAKAEESGFEGFEVERGEKIFYKMHNKDGKPVGCVTCHTKDLTRGGENVKTGKRIDPLAPSVNPKSLTNVKNVKKWLRRNFNDVFGRKGTAREKGDVLTYIFSK